MILSNQKIGYLNFETEIQNLVNLKCFDKFLIIVPTNRKAKDLRKRVIRNSSAPTIYNLNIETLTTVSHSILSLNRDYSIPDESTALLLLKQSFQEFLNSGNAMYFNFLDEEIPKGTLKRLRGTLTEYKRNGISPVEIKKEFSEEGVESAKALDVAEVFNIYKEKYIQLNFMEVGDVYLELLNIGPDKFEKSFKEKYPNVDKVYVFDFSAFTLPEIKLLHRIGETKDVGLFIRIDYHRNNENLFSHLDDVIKEFERYGMHISTAEDEEGDADLYSALAKHLFNSNYSPSRIKADEPIFEKYRDKISYIASRSARDEVRNIAKLIKQLVIEERVEPHKICVVFNIIRDYSAIIRDEFEQYGIPYDLTDRIDLNSFQPVIAIISFLEIIESDYYFRDIIRAISFNYFRYDMISENDAEADKSSLRGVIALLADMKVLSGYHNWINELERKADFYSANKDRWINDIGEDNYERNLTQVEGLKSFFTQLDVLLSPFKREMTFDEFYAQLELLVKKIRILDNILSDKNKYLELNIKAISKFLSSTRELFYVLRTFQENDSSKRFNLKYYLTQLRELVNSTRINYRERSNIGVQVTTLEEIRGIKFDYLIIGGLLDGNLPTKYSPEIFMPEKFAINELKHNVKERYLFYQVLNSFDKMLFLSTLIDPDDDSRLFPCSFLRELLTIVFRKNYETKAKCKFDFSKIYYSNFEISNLLGSDAEIRKQHLGGESEEYSKLQEIISRDGGE